MSPIESCYKCLLEGGNSTGRRGQCYMYHAKCRELEIRASFLLLSEMKLCRRVLRCNHCMVCRRDLSSRGSKEAQPGAELEKEQIQPTAIWACMILRNIMHACPMADVGTYFALSAGDEQQGFLCHCQEVMYIVTFAGELNAVISDASIDPLDYKWKNLHRR